VTAINEKPIAIWATALVDGNLAKRQHQVICRTGKPNDDVLRIANWDMPGKWGGLVGISQC